MIADIFGYVGTFCLNAATLPQVRKIIKDGHANGLTKQFLLLLFVGFASMIAYSIMNGRQIPLIISYSFNLVVYSIMSYYKFFPRKHGQAFHS